MNDIDFNCSDCVFANVDQSGVQSGCELKRLEKFNAKLNIEDGRFHFTRFCNTYRPPEWAELIGVQSSQIDNIALEIQPRITYIIDFDKNIDNLKQNIAAISGKIGSIIILNSKVEYNEEIMAIISSVNTKNYYIIQLLDNLTVEEKLDIAFKNAKNGWTIFLSKGDLLPKNYYDAIYSRINIELRRISFSINHLKSFIIQSALYRFLRTKNPSKSFIEAIEEMVYEDTDSIPSWGELFNEYK